MERMARRMKRKIVSLRELNPMLKWRVRTIARKIIILRKSNGTNPPNFMTKIILRKKPIPKKIMSPITIYERMSNL
jgi:hypothetical protein